MKSHIDLKVIDERLDLFRRAPGSPKKPIDIGSQHRARVVETKKRVKR